jgi:hypothetical protein
MKYFYTLLVFLSGMAFTCNLAFLKYGIPENFNGGWGDAAICAALAVFAGILSHRWE